MKKALTEFRNIRVTNDGYQVVISRAKVEVSKLFAGHSRKSLRAAEKFRNQLLKELPNKRINPIPRRVLSALKLKSPVGVYFATPKRCNIRWDIMTKQDVGRIALSPGRAPSNTLLHRHGITSFCRFQMLCGIR